MQKLTKLGPTLLAILSTDLKNEKQNKKTHESRTAELLYTTARSSRIFWRPAVRKL